MVPITNLSLGTLEPQAIKNASGLFNVTRNLGGAGGLALINTLLNNRTDLHLARLREQVAWGRAGVEETLASMTQAFSTLGSNASAAALKQMSLIVRQQSTVMAFGDVFLALTVVFVSLVVLAPLMRRPRMGPGGGGGH
jgi:DHA2 family multidrug resistance protein